MNAQSQLSVVASDIPQSRLLGNQQHYHHLPTESSGVDLENEASHNIVFEDFDQAFIGPNDEESYTNEQNQMSDTLRPVRHGNPCIPSNVGDERQEYGSYFRHEDFEAETRTTANYRTLRRARPTRMQYSRYQANDVSSFSSGDSILSQQEAYNHRRTKSAIRGLSVNYNEKLRAVSGRSNRITEPQSYRRSFPSQHTSQLRNHQSALPGSDPPHLRHSVSGFPRSNAMHNLRVSSSIETSFSDHPQASTEQSTSATPSKPHYVSITVEELDESDKLVRKLMISVRLLRAKIEEKRKYAERGDVDEEDSLQIESELNVVASNLKLHLYQHRDAMNYLVKGLVKIHELEQSIEAKETTVTQLTEENENLRARIKEMEMEMERNLQDPLSQETRELKAFRNLYEIMDAANETHPSVQNLHDVTPPNTSRNGTHVNVARGKGIQSVTSDSYSRSSSVGESSGVHENSIGTYVPFEDVRDKKRQMQRRCLPVRDSY